MTEPVPNEETIPASPDPFADADADDEEDDAADDDEPRRPPPTALESLINALLDSGPEAAEHVVKAGQELLAAAQTIIDATERAVEEQRDLRHPAEESPGSTATVHPIDRSE
jgi:hypothetical protein